MLNIINLNYINNQDTNMNIENTYFLNILSIITKIHNVFQIINNVWKKYKYKFINKF